MNLGRKRVYSSMPTRFESFDRFLGPGIINDVVTPMNRNCTDNQENLRDKFNSNLPRRMMPTTFGLTIGRVPIMGVGPTNGEE